jgi:hypothetical protein
LRGEGWVDNDFIFGNFNSKISNKFQKVLKIEKIKYILKTSRLMMFQIYVIRTHWVTLWCYA